MEKKRILILHAPIGMGHPMVAKALEETLRNRFPNLDVKNFDILDSSVALFQKGFPFFYTMISTRVPALYRMAYRFYNRKDRGKFLYWSAKIFMTRHFVRMLLEFSPDFIVATHPLPMHLISMTRRRNLIDIPSANVCTDFGCHSLWMNPDINYYFVANDEVKRCLSDWGVAPEKIEVTGIPISMSFSHGVDRQKVFHGLGFKENRPTVLFVGGQFSHSRMVSIIRNITLGCPDIQCVVVGGRDRNLIKKFFESELKKYKNVRLFGFVNNMHELMAVSDLIFSKAGGSTVAESLALKVPLIVHRIIPGQEEDNMSYLVRNGAALYMPHEVSIHQTIISLLRDRVRLEKMRQSCERIQKPMAAQDIADYIHRLISAP